MLFRSLVIGRLLFLVTSIVFVSQSRYLVPVNTAAYTRIKEYYDFYAVPLHLISRALPQAFTQMTDYMTSAASNTANNQMLTSVPNTTLNLVSLSLQTVNGQDVFDDAGLPYFYGASKILDMLGYGSFLSSTNTAKAAITSAYLGRSEERRVGKECRL